MRSLTLSSPAKINLYLKVIHKRPDGYHQLVTLFHRISLKDTLRLEKAKPGIFSLLTNRRELSTGENNLITQAYRLLRKRFPKIGGVKVRLNKKIPIGGGLGGGSSNAAFFLLGMKKLYRLKISEKELQSIGKRLGADIPFFLTQSTLALGLERGDKLISKPCRRKSWFILLISPYTLSTQSVYAKLSQSFSGASLTKSLAAVNILCNFFGDKELRQYSLPLANDLEKPAFSLRPDLARVKANIVQKGIHKVMMSGSGPTFFVLASGKRQAVSLAKSLKHSFPKKKILVCHSY